LSKGLLYAKIYSGGDKMFDYNGFKEKLENVHTFPCEYLFKFVANKENIDELKDVLKGEKLTEKASSKGNFTSVTIRKKVKTSDEVVDTYKKVTQIKGIITL